MKVGAFIGGSWLDGVAQEARRAEEIGYDFVSCDESSHDSILTMTVAATSTSRVELETAITVAFSRSPMVLAMEAWDIQRLSNGRFVLGLGTQWKDHLERRLSTPWAPPAPRMKEYVQCLRASGSRRRAFPWVSRWKTPSRWGGGNLPRPSLHDRGYGRRRR